MKPDSSPAGTQELLVVSQFTLFATFKKPKPDFHQAMGGASAEELYEAFVAQLRTGGRVATGSFGAMMQVELCNDGPVTVELVAAPAGPTDGKADGKSGKAEAKSRAEGAEAHEAHGMRGPFFLNEPLRGGRVALQAALPVGAAWLNNLPWHASQVQPRSP